MSSRSPRRAWAVRCSALLGASLLVVALATSCGDDDGGSTFMGYISASLDGGPAVTMSGIPGITSFGAYYTVSNPPAEAMTTVVMAGGFGVPPMAMIAFDGNQTGTFDVAAYEAMVTHVASDGTMYGALGAPVGSGTVTVTDYGAVGELIEGTFDVIAHEFDPVTGNPTGTTVNLTGSFCVVREVDDYQF